jgi:hypothetical protein
VCVKESCVKVLWVKEWCGTGGLQVLCPSIAWESACVKELCEELCGTEVCVKVWCKNVLCVLKCCMYKCCGQVMCDHVL